MSFIIHYSVVSNKGYSSLIHLEEDVMDNIVDQLVSALVMMSTIDLMVVIDMMIARAKANLATSDQILKQMTGG
jgi:hypothetical protein